MLKVLIVDDEPLVRRGIVLGVEIGRASCRERVLRCV